MEDAEYLVRIERKKIPFSNGEETILKISPIPLTNEFIFKMCECLNDLDTESVSKTVFDTKKINERISELKLRSEKILLLERYSLWLTKKGYMDTDWKDEEPFAIDEFLKEDEE